MLSTETLLRIWLSTEYMYNGFRPSSAAVDTGHTRELNLEVYFAIFLSEFVVRIVFFLTKSVGKLLCRRFSYEEVCNQKILK